MLSHGNGVLVDDHPAPIFGLTFSSMSAKAVAAHISQSDQFDRQASQVLVTPNIQHIAEMGRSERFREAMHSADLVICDGFPVATLGRARGLSGLRRVTGREVVRHILSDEKAVRNQRLFFIVDSSQTRDRLYQWRKSQNVEFDISVDVAPAKFVSGSQHAKALIEKMSEFRPSIVFVCLGAPESEIFASQCKKRLYGSWILCVGQSLRVFVGLSPKPPAVVELLCLEWLWRIGNEPVRLLPRYASASWRFLGCVVRELRQ